MANDVFPGATLRQLVEWGFPQRSLRPTPAADQAFSVVHITGNSRLPSAENEAAWRINDPANQNSATFFVNRNGSIVQTLGDPLHMDPWANGDVKSPDVSNRRIAALVRDGANANTRTLVAIENVGYEPGYSITAAQEDADARILAYYHAKAGVPISRETIIGHYQLNSLTRPNCPGVNKALIDRIVTKARSYADPLPDTAVPEVDVIDPALIIPPFLVTLMPGGTAYGQSNRTDLKAENWPSIVTPHVPCYGLPVDWKPRSDGSLEGPRQTDGKVPLAAIRVKTTRGPEVWFYGPDLMVAELSGSTSALENRLRAIETAATGADQAIHAVIATAKGT